VEGAWEKGKRRFLESRDAQNRKIRRLPKSAFTRETLLSQSRVLIRPNLFWQNDLGVNFDSAHHRTL